MKRILSKFYSYLIKKGICKTLNKVKKEQEAIYKKQKIQAAKNHVKFMKTTIYKKHYKNKAWKDFYNSNN